MKRQVILIVILSAILVIVLVGSIWYVKQAVPRIAYVRSYDLIEKYQGTLQARGVFEQQKSSMTTAVDSLKMNFERARMDYLNRASQMTAGQRQNQEQLLGQQQNQVLQYSQAVEERLEEADTKMMQGILNQVNSFVEEYAKENGFDLVLGTTLSGSLLYGEAGLDVTDDLLAKLNDRFKGKAKTAN
jgi:outer membrane protein